MKKFLFLGLAAMMAFTSCTKDETLATAQNGAIGFDVAADKATRSVEDPSLTTANIKDFAVYGWMNDYTGKVFTDELVSGSNDNGWTYQNTQYWIPGNNYYFAALAPSVGRAWELTVADTQTEANYGIGQVKFTNDGTQDLLYWAQGPIVGASDNGPVAIKFNHLLSKVKFSFVNNMDNANAKLIVKDIVITNAETEGNIDLAVANWWDNDDWKLTADKTAEFKFGNAAVASATAAEQIAQFAEIESYNEMLLFPVNNKEFNITFTVELWMGNAIAATYDHKTSVKTTLEMGKAYDFKAVLNVDNVTGSDDPNDELKPIQFTVDVIDWVEAGEVILPEYKPTIVEDAAQLAAAFEKGGEILLANDITVPATITVPEGIAVNLDLNGKTLTNNSTDLGYGVADVIVVYGELTINGEGTVTGPTRCVWARSAAAKVTINGGNYVGALQDSFQDVAIYASGDGVVNIYGGTFETVTADTESYAADIHSVLNVYDKKGTIKVYGGTFKGQNPAAPGTEPAGYDNFVADGYESVETTTGVWEVVKK
jgi:hypothetical protein